MIETYNEKSVSVQLERHFLSWRSIAIGVLVSLLVYMVCTALGAGIGGITVSHVIDKNENGFSLLAGASIWIGLSTAISLFLGSYFASRYTGTLHPHGGASQGIVVSALFFLLIASGPGASLGSLSSVITNLSVVTTNDRSGAEEMARIVGDTGWILFVTFVIGIVSSAVGGYEGTVGNRRRPFKSV
jgi:hypothetical protein